MTLLCVGRDSFVEREGERVRERKVAEGERKGERVKGRESERVRASVRE